MFYFCIDVKYSEFQQLSYRFTVRLFGRLDEVIHIFVVLSQSERVSFLPIIIIRHANQFLEKTLFPNLKYPIAFANWFSAINSRRLPNFDCNTGSSILPPPPAMNIASNKSASSTHVAFSRSLMVVAIEFMLSIIIFLNDIRLPLYVIC